MKTLLRKMVVFVLTLEARLVLLRFKPKIVAITGSVGKTSTKDSVYSVLSKSFFARKSEKSFNSEIGVPLTILGVPNAWSSPVGWLENILEGFHVLVSRTTYPEWLVLEVGADRPGDIKNLKWLRPHVVVYTRFPDVPVHVEYFDSPEEVIKEKKELGKALRPSGTLVVNADDSKMNELPLKEGQRLLSYGVHESAAVRGVATTMQYDNGVPYGVSCEVVFQNKSSKALVRGVLGQHHIHPVLAAITVAISEGISFEHAVEYVASYVPPAGRMRVLEGKNGSVLVDDTYNASPIAVLAGLSTLEEIKTTGKKIVVLGDMMELGSFSVEEHQKVGKRAAAVADTFVAVGVRMKGAADSARELKSCERIEAVQDASEALKLIARLIGPGDVVYVKGSQSMRMESVVEGLMVDPSKAGELLVRQDTEWKRR